MCETKNPKEMENWYYTYMMWFLLAALFLQLMRKKRDSNLPPGPAGWPIIGNLFDLGATPYKRLYELKPKYGSIIWLRIGSMKTMVIQSPEAASELFKNHDANFCDRPSLQTFSTHKYNEGSIAVGSYGPHWRMLRRLCSTQLFVNKRINESGVIRQKCVDEMIRNMEQDSAAARSRGEAGYVVFSTSLFAMAFNLIGNLTLSRDLIDLGSDEFFESSERVMELSGKPNIADFFPLLKWFDLQGIMKDMEREMKALMNIVSGFVEERIEERKSDVRCELKKDMLDNVLEFKGDGNEEPVEISRPNVTVIILEMFFGAAETTSSTLEWAMAELFRSPESMKKLKEELETIIGKNNKVEDSDINKFHYLQAVVKETLRLHPPIPLLIPRKAIEDTKYMGYSIPKGTQVLVNAWAIGRDAEFWSDPLSFKPERFLESNVDYKGQNFEFIPFGSGRRMCIGIPLAQRILPFTLACLVHYFNWELDRSISPETMDMSERMGITLRKLIPLKAIPNRCDA